MHEQEPLFPNLPTINRDEELERIMEEVIDKVDWIHENPTKFQSKVKEEDFRLDIVFQSFAESLHERGATEEQITIALHYLAVGLLFGDSLAGLGQPDSVSTTPDEPIPAWSRENHIIKAIKEMFESLEHGDGAPVLRGVGMHIMSDLVTDIANRLHEDPAKWARECGVPGLYQYGAWRQLNAVANHLIGA